jgi:hypothetical protein
MNDTSPEIFRIVREKMLARTGQERLTMGSQMFEAARAMVLASFPPDLPEIEIKRPLCMRFYGNEVNEKAFVQRLMSNGKK